MTLPWSRQGFDSPYPLHCLTQMTPEYIKTLNIIQLISEISVVAFYIVSIFPGFYYTVFWIVIPLVVLNFVLSIVKKDNTVSFTSVNLVMSIVAFVPVIGWLALFSGIFMSIMSAQILLKTLGIYDYNFGENSSAKTTETHTKDTSDKEESIQTVDVTKKPKPKVVVNKSSKTNTSK
jgi:hypothetical protein